MTGEWPNHAANPSIASRLQFTRPAGRVAELVGGFATKELS